MFAPILQHVDEGRTYFARRGEWSGMVTIAEYLPASVEMMVDRSCHANREPARREQERRAVMRFNDEMNVIALHGEVHETKCTRRRRAQGSTHREKERLAPQAR